MEGAPEAWQTPGMTLGPSVAARADALARQGRTAEALLLLNMGASERDPDALLELAVWRLSGEFVARDLGASRDFFRQAAEAGQPDAARVYNHFLANGTGGPADWPLALELLARRAKTDRDAARQLEIIQAMRGSPDADYADLPQGRTLSASPEVILFPALFTPVECRFLIEAAEPLMEPALTIHPQTRQQLRNPVRTSDAAGFPLALENPAVHALNRRLAAVSNLPVSHGEPLQVLRYRPGQQYRAHHDALPGVDNQRIVTVLVYLNSGYGGGETHFFANNLSVKGDIGDALLFRNAKPDGRPDETAAHAGLPVTSGVKLIASRWIREKPLSLEKPSV